MENPIPYFDDEMQQEFHLAVAKREASRIIKNVKLHKTRTYLEKHLDTKYSRIVASS